VISPRIDKLLEHVDSDYASVIVAAKRARQINSYYHNLGEGRSTSSRRRWSTPARRTT
jgi:DNA-directed RNA polymerase subunit omega